MFRQPNTPTRFDDAELADLARGVTRTVTHSGADNLDSNYLSTSSFAYDPYESGLKSTQQLKVDWSRFENHTFFNSATAKVNVAFDRIVNGYPFDGSRKDVERYLDGLTGYEKWVLDSFPRNVGYLFFSQSYISVVDHQGSLFPDLVENNTGNSVLDPGSDPYTIEAYLYLPPESAGTQVLFQKQAASNVGLSLYVKSGSSSATTEVAFGLYSGSANLVVSGTVSRSRFVHLAGVYDRDDSGRAFLYVDGVLNATSPSVRQFDSVLTNNAPVTIGSGSSFSLGALTVTPDKTLSGALDELRVFRDARSALQIQSALSRNLFAQDTLALYYRFNEPTGSLSGGANALIDSIALDSSGNGMHAYVVGFAPSLRSTGSIAPPLSNERLDLNPVVFPGFAPVQTLNAKLLASASLYDQDNPNLITRLVPKHYLTDGQDYEGLLTIDGSIDDAYGGSSVPGTGQLGSTQLFLALLYTWAKHFDELKLFVDAFSRLHYVDYDELDTSPDTFLPFALREFGIKMPNFFSDAAFAQYKDGEDVSATYSLDQQSLLSVQNAIMRRVLTNMGEIVRSKGTLHSVEAFFRSVGIDPNGSFKIKERGGPTSRALDVSRETRLQTFQFLDFSKGGLLTSNFLSSSRVEPGAPTTKAGTFVNGVSNSPNDGLWTSGSWTYEGLYRFPRVAGVGHPNTQSLVRFHVTASSGTSERLVLNLLAFSGSVPQVVLYARPGSQSSLTGSALLALTASADLFDGDPWYVSIGRARSDLTGTNFLSATYFLRLAKQNFGHVTDLLTAEGQILELSGAGNVAWTQIVPLNTSGTFFRVGSASIASAAGFLDDSVLVPNVARVTSFDGQLAQTRFWSKRLTDGEWMEHARNPASAGVENPDFNFNFNTTMSGSWERLRLDLTTQQSVTSSDASGNIVLFDYSQNNQHASGTGFLASSRVLLPSVIGYSLISPEIDEAITSEKVRVRGYLDQGRVDRTPWAQTAPVYEVPKSEEPQDDPRLSIEFSLVDALNRDVITMFATLDQLDTALGASENEFSPQYQNLEHLKRVYFQRLVGKLNFRAFFDFFRWFDSSVSYFVEHLIPRKTTYYGTNFVVESHLLERHKKQYFHYEGFLAEANRPLVEDKILLQQVEGTVSKF